MASRPEAWRQRIRSGLAATPRTADPGSGLLAHVVGEPPPELLALLAAPSREAAVLLGLIDRPTGPHILLTERAGHLTHHPGQISLPGGQLDKAEDPVAAALREAREEVGLDPGQVDVLGRLPPQLTVTGFVVTPIVGWIAGEFEARPDPAEVQTAFEVPLGHLLAPRHRRRSKRRRFGAEFVTEEFTFERFRIWGATASILASFLEVIDVKTIS